MKVIGKPKGYISGVKNVFWYDYFYYCARCQAMISQDRTFKHNVKGAIMCPFCGEALRTRPRRSKGRDRYREAHSKRI